jgi:hypothetical protein
MAYSYFLVGLCLAFKLDLVPLTGNPPTRRQLTSMCYDSNSDSLFVYGGFKETGVSYRDLWTYSVSLRKWRLIVPTSYSVPPESMRNGCFVDASR